MKLSEQPLAPGCPNCGKGNYKQRKLDWLGVEIMICWSCGHVGPAQTKPDPRQAHASDERESKPL